MKNDINSINDRKRAGADGKSLETKNPLLLNKTETKMEELRRRKERDAAVKLQQFWQKGKIPLKWKKTVIALKDRKKERFANGVLFIMFLLQVVGILVLVFTGIYIINNAVFGFCLYLFLLVWAATIPLNSTNWQLKIGLVLAFLGGMISGVVYPVLLIILMVIMPLLYLFFKKMTEVMQYNYATDLHGLAARLSTKIIAGLPVVCYLCMTNITCMISYNVIRNDVCPYIPSAYYDPNILRFEFSVVKGYWVDCTESEIFDRYYPQQPRTVNEIMMEQGMKEYVANSMKNTITFFQLLEVTLLVLTSQVVLRICRLTINDILSVNVSGWELALSILTVVRVACIFVFGGLSLEIMSMSQYRMISFIFQFSYFGMIIITCLLIIKLVRDAATVINIEKEMYNKKKKTSNNAQNKKDNSTTKRSHSVEMIHKRSRRFSSMQSNTSFAGDDIV
eukprot:g5227.t1